MSHASRTTEQRAFGAALLDRDGTLIADRHYLADPADVVLLPGTVAGLRRLAAAGVPAIVCTNQSGIARGLITLPQYRAVRERLDALLATEGVRLLDTLACPHHPETTGVCDCRKPASGLHRRAALLHQFDPAHAMYIGDRWRDVAPAVELGGTGAIVRSSHTSDDELALARGGGIADFATLDDAVRALLGDA